MRTKTGHPCTTRAEYARWRGSHAASPMGYEEWKAWTLERLTLAKLIKAASDGYPEGLVMSCHRHPEEDHGDTLALFLARELKDTFDPERRARDQYDDALIAVRRASGDLEAVAASLESARSAFLSRAYGPKQTRQNP